MRTLVPPRSARWAGAPRAPSLSPPPSHPHVRVAPLACPDDVSRPPPPSSRPSPSARAHFPLEPGRLCLYTHNASARVTGHGARADSNWKGSTPCEGSRWSECWRAGGTARGGPQNGSGQGGSREGQAQLGGRQGKVVGASDWLHSGRRPRPVAHLFGKVAARCGCWRGIRRGRRAGAQAAGVVRRQEEPGGDVSGCRGAAGPQVIQCSAVVAAASTSEISKNVPASTSEDGAASPLLAHKPDPCRFQQTCRATNWLLRSRHRRRLLAANGERVALQHR